MNFLKTIQEELKSEVVSSLARENNEQTDRMHIAISTANTSVFLAFMKRASAESGLNLIYNIVKKGDFKTAKQISSGLTSNETEILKKMSDEGNAQISQIIPDKKSPLVTIISRFSGVKNATATMQMGFASSLILNKLNEEVNKQNLDVQGLAALFADQKDHIIEDTPKELMSRLSNQIVIGGIMGLGNSIINTSASISHKSSEKVNIESNKNESDFNINTEDNKPKLKNWIIPGLFLLLLAGAVGYYYYLNNVKESEIEAVALKDTLVVIPQASDSLNKLKVDSIAKIGDTKTGDTLVVELEEITLPNNQKISIEKGSPAHGIFTFLSDTSSNLSKKITTNSLGYDNSTDQLAEGVQENIDNIGKIMRAYSSSRLKITSFQNPAGDSTVSSLKAAKNALVIKKLILLTGVQNNRIDASGALTSKTGKAAKELNVLIFKK
jgi:OmpA-OmpF porin, OOP family